MFILNYEISVRVRSVLNVDLGNFDVNWNPACIDLKFYSNICNDLFLLFSYFYDVQYELSTRKIIGRPKMVQYLH